MDRLTAAVASLEEMADVKRISRNAGLIKLV